MESTRPGRRGRATGTVIHVVGCALLAVTVVLIIVGPDLMPRFALATCLLGSVAGGVLYGVFLSRHSRNTQVSIERAYSAHLEELSQRLRNMAYRDAVTGLYNHRYFREQLTHEVERAVRYGAPLSLILLDMNNFKQINDRYGHFMGDRFLGLVGEVIAKHSRSSDVGARYGGDEFVLILPNTTWEEARQTGDKLAAAVESCAAMTTTGESVQLGISFGVATCPDDARTGSELIESADARLYEAKARRQTHRASTNVA